MIGEQVICEAPKVILHTHFEGSIPPDTLNSLAKRNNCKLELPTNNNKFYDWKEFLSSYSDICNCLKTEYDFFEAIVSYAKALSSHNVVYAELHFTPWAHLRRGVTRTQIEAGFEAALEHVKKEYSIELNFIFDLIRSDDENCYELFEWIKELKTFVLAIGLSGDRTGKPLQTYNQFASYVKSNNFKIVAHAGELDGASSVDTAVNGLKVDRLTHGVRVLENRPLFNNLIKRGMHFELCPSSNRCLGIVDSEYSEIATIIKAGARYSINPDDETLFHTNICKEILILKGMGIISYEDVRCATVEAMQSSFTNNHIKDHLIDVINKYWNDHSNDTY